MPIDKYTSVYGKWVAIFSLFMLAVFFHANAAVSPPIESGVVVSGAPPTGSQISCDDFKSASSNALKNHLSIVSEFMGKTEKAMQSVVNNSCITALSMLNFDLSSLIPDFNLFGIILQTALSKFTQFLTAKVCDAVNNVVGDWNNIIGAVSGNWSVNSAIENWGNGVVQTFPIGTGGSGISSGGGGSSIDLITPGDKTGTQCVTTNMGKVCTDGSINGTGPGAGGGSTGPYPGGSTGTGGGASTGPGGSTTGPGGGSSTGPGNGGLEGGGGTTIDTPVDTGTSGVTKPPEPGTPGINGAQVGAYYGRLKMECSIKNDEYYREREQYNNDIAVGKTPRLTKKELTDLYMAAYYACGDAEVFYGRYAGYLSGATPPPAVGSAPSSFTKSAPTSGGSKSQGGAGYVYGQESVNNGNAISVYGQDQKSSSGFSLPVRK